MIIPNRPSPHPISNCKEATKMQIRIASRWQPSNQGWGKGNGEGGNAFNNHRFHHSCKILQHRQHLLFYNQEYHHHHHRYHQNCWPPRHHYPESPHHSDIVTFKARSMTRLVRLRDSTSEEEEALETTSRAVWRRKKLNCFLWTIAQDHLELQGNIEKKHQLCWFFRYCHT